MQLSLAEKDFLKKLAYESIRTYFEGGQTPDLTLDSEILKKNCGAFVTIKIAGQLQGCIGYIQGIKPLYEAIIEMARAAAFDDHRFRQLQKSQLDQIDIEISVLSPLQKIVNTDEIEVGKHGLIVRQGIYSGLLLPQVATEYNWDRETFLKHTCIKAGLPENAYKESQTEILIFSAEVF